MTFNKTTTTIVTNKTLNKREKITQILKANIIFECDTAGRLQRICNFQSKFVAHIQTKLNDLAII